jgi:type I restriction enzyme M protein
MKSDDLTRVRRTLWAAADEMRANSTLSPAEYRGPVLGLIFLAYAEQRYEEICAELDAKATARRPVTPDDYRARSVLYVPEQARLSHLVALPEGQDLGKAIDDAMKAVEAENPELRDVLPRGYQRLEKSTLSELLRLFAPLPRKLSGDAFGLIYEDFLSNFAKSEGRLGGEFFTPYSIVRLIVEIIQPFHGRVYDPACGSGGMFVQCAKFVERHQKSATRELSVYGVEQKEGTVPLAKMNLALHGLSGDIRLAKSYYEDPHRSIGGFDFVMANPPFNVDKVDKNKLAGDPRFPFGIPKPDNANYLWIQQFYAALNERGRAGFVMANSAGDASHSEREIRRQVIESGAVDVMVAVGTNFFYTVTLPVTLWFLDKDKRGSDRKTRCSSATGGTCVDRSTARTETSCPNKSNSSPTSRGSTAAKRSRRPTEATTCSRNGSRMIRTSTYLGCARLRREPRSRHKAGASTPAATPERPHSMTMATTSPRSLLSFMTSSPASATKPTSCDARLTLPFRKSSTHDYRRPSRRWLR